jgi:hypothetical protein
MKKTMCCVLFIFLAMSAFCQKKDTTLFSHFQLRQTFGNSDGTSSPAELQLTLPGGGKDSWLVDAAVALRIDPLSGDYGNSKIVAEYHRNTALDEPQNNYQFGYNYQYLKPNDGLSIAINSNLKYVRDVVDTSNSIALTANFSPYLAGLHQLNLGRNAYLDNRHYTYSITPYVELQYQRLFATTSAVKNGDILRPVINISGSFALNRPATDKKVIKPSKLLEFCYGYSARYAVVNTSTDERFTKLFKAGLNYYLIDNKSVSISLGANYNLGSDPLNGLADQNFWQFALQAQI